MDRSRTAAMLFAALLLLSALFSAAALALHAGHDCEGDDCPVCAALSACLRALRRIAGCAVAAAILFAAVRHVRACAGRARQAFLRDTPVLLKVKLSD